MVGSKFLPFLGYSFLSFNHCTPFSQLANTPDIKLLCSDLGSPTNVTYFDFLLKQLLMFLFVDNDDFILEICCSLLVAGLYKVPTIVN